MGIQRLVVALTVVNLGLLVFLLGQARSVAAQRTDSVLRARALEIVDDEGKVRASIHVHPAAKGKDGKPYPGAVVFRMRGRNAAPGVKMETNDSGGAGLRLFTESDQASILLDAGGKEPFIKLLTLDGRVKLLAP